MGLGVIEQRVGVLGASSFVGACLLSLMTKAKWRVTAFSRREVLPLCDGVAWRQLHATGDSSRPARSGDAGDLPLWICVAPIWVLPDYFDLLEAHGVRRIVALSSTSLFTKQDSSDHEEQALAARFVDAEARVQAWAEGRGVEWVILRPTLIYDFVLDKNITEIARFIRRFGFFPVFGKANGLRQPIHAEDVASACLAALEVPCAANRAYNISGGETMTYREMVSRVFFALGQRPHFLAVPLWTFRLAVAFLRFLPRFRKWSPAMAERMNRNLVFDHAEAARDLGFKPRAFVLADGG
jgi:nucleoside-diphosphate-sugar epimerase